MAQSFSGAGIDNLKSLIGKRGIAKANRYEVDFSGLTSLGVCTGDEARDLSLLVDSTTLPGRQLTTFGYDLYRHTTEFPTGYVNDALQMEFNMTADFFAKNIFDKWINKVVPKEEYLMSYTNEYKCPITIKQLDLKNNVIYHVMIDQCFPKAIRGINYNAGEDGVAKFAVEFAYNDLNFPTDN